MDLVKSARDDLLELTAELQGQTEIPLWVLGSSNTVRSIASGRPEQYGPRGLWFFRLFTLLGVSEAARFALQLVGSVVVTLWWLKCRKVDRSERDAETVFVGFGAGPELQMVEKVRAERNCRVAHVDQTDPCSMARVVVPRLTQLWNLSRVESRRVVHGLRLARQPLIRDNARQWLISSSVRFSAYVFCKAWTEALPVEVGLVFIAADVPAFAALDARSLGAPRAIEFRQHGLHKISIVFPPFQRVISINRQEASHISMRLPAAKVMTVDSAPADQISNHTPTMLIVSTYDSDIFCKHDHIDLIRKMCAWAGEKGVQVVVRPHPSEGGAFWLSHFPEIPVDVSAGGLRGALEAIRPLFVVGWWSTSLVDALRAGVLPVLILSGSEKALEDMVFPLQDVTVCWEDGQNLMTQMVLDRNKYGKTVSDLQDEL